jgi:hypothetical protein
VVLTVAFALIGAASAAMGATAYASPPGGPGDTITIDPVVQVTAASGGGETLSVTAGSTTPLTSMRLHLLAPSSDQDVLDLAMSQTASGPRAGESTWSSQPVSTGAPQELPLGIYNVAVDATDEGGTSVSYQPAGTFAFQDKPSIAANAANLVISYSNSTPAISGTVTELPPGATTTQPYVGQVILADSVLGEVRLTTNGVGQYSYRFAHPEPGEIFSIEVPPTSSVAAATTAGAEFSAQTDPVAMSASLSASTVSYGRKVTASGTVSYQPGSSYVPLPGQTVRVYDGPAADRPVATAVTGANGHFTATLPKEAASVHWVVQAGGPAASPYLGAASVTLPMRVNLPTAVSGFGVALSVFGKLSYRGCLAMAAGVPGSIPAAGSGVTIQYSAAPDGPWHTLATAATSQNKAKCGSGRAFSGTANARVNYAYYRAVYGGTNVAGTGYLSAASGGVLAWKYEDRITGFSASPRTVAKGGKLTVQGQLQYYSGKWRDYGGQQVYIILRPKGSSTWYYLVIARTDSLGRFSETFKDPVTATWSAEFFGNSTHLATLAALVYVTLG